MGKLTKQDVASGVKDFALFLMAWGLVDATLAGLGALEGYLGARVLSTDYEGYDIRTSTKAMAIAGAVLGAAVGICLVFGIIVLFDNKDSFTKKASVASRGIVPVIVSGAIFGAIGSAIQKNSGRNRLPLGMQAAAGAVGAPLAMLMLAAVFLGTICVGGSVYAAGSACLKQRKSPRQKQMDFFTDAFASGMQAAASGLNEATLASKDLPVVANDPQVVVVGSGDHETAENVPREGVNAGLSQVPNVGVFKQDNLIVVPGSGGSPVQIQASYV